MDKKLLSIWGWAILIKYVLQYQSLNRLKDNWVESIRDLVRWKKDTIGIHGNIYVFRVIKEVVGSGLWWRGTSNIGQAKADYLETNCAWEMAIKTLF